MQTLFCTLSCSGCVSELLNYWRYVEVDQDSLGYIYTDVMKDMDSGMWSERKCAECQEVQFLIYQRYTSLSFIIFQSMANSEKFRVPNGNQKHDLLCDNRRVDTITTELQSLSWQTRSFLQHTLQFVGLSVLWNTLELVVNTRKVEHSL